MFLYILQIGYDIQFPLCFFGLKTKYFLNKIELRKKTAKNSHSISDTILIITCFVHMQRSAKYRTNIARIIKISFTSQSKDWTFLYLCLIQRDFRSYDLAPFEFIADRIYGVTNCHFIWLLFYSAHFHHTDRNLNIIYLIDNPLVLSMQKECNI